MSNNYNNSNRLLYVTVAIAALFVAILSGTFAYFTASATNNNITGSIADVGITLEVSKLPPKSNVSVAPNGANLIPFDLMDVPNTALNTSSITKAINGGCIDDDDYSACDVFQIKVKANNPLKVDGYIKVEADNYLENGVTRTSNIPNVKWMLLKGRSTSNYGNIAALNNNLTTSYLTYDNVKPIGVPLVSETTKGNTTDGFYFTNLSTNDQTINTSFSYYYFMVWLEDINDLQDDEGKYKGTISFRGYGDSQGKVTASFGSGS